MKIKFLEILFVFVLTLWYIFTITGFFYLFNIKFNLTTTPTTSSTTSTTTTKTLALGINNLID